jgi:DinB superfamily
VNSIELYRHLLRSAHQFLEGTMADVTPEQLTWDPPGRAFSIGANYAHVLGAEDMTIQGLLRGKDPLAASTWSGRTGASEAPPLGPDVDLKGWSQRAKLDLAAMRRYGEAVHAATDEYLASIQPGELDGPIDLSRFGFGQQTVLFVLTAILANASLHTGEISCLKGQQGAKGYPV